ncbi:MAG: lysoplasmalogenase [Anaerolineales bacterium]|nr:lysoplasmalogenase [Anaerolineales bacterium]
MTYLTFLAIYLLLSVAYLATMNRRPYPLSWLVKAAPILLLAIFALGEAGGMLRWLLAAALLFCAGGDIALEWDRDRLFVLGLALFLVGHLFYVASFLLEPAWAGRPVWVIPLVLLTAGLIARRLWPNLGKLRGPVVAYIIVIVAMACSAVLLEGGSWLVIIGALTFMASDTLIALDKFHRPIPGAHYYIMISYYLAQALIVTGLLESL